MFTRGKRGQEVSSGFSKIEGMLQQDGAGLFKNQLFKAGDF
jgi:hypothetical protein